MRARDFRAAALVFGLVVALRGCAGDAPDANAVRTDNAKPPVDEPAKPVPMIGDEISLARIKADWRKYVLQRLVLCGGVQISRYYLDEYRDAERSHFCLHFQEVDKNGQIVRGSSTCTLYLSRDLNGSSQIIEEVLKTQERNPRNGKRARAHVTISRLYRGSGHEWNNSFELLDVQFLTEDSKAWKPGEIRP